MVFKSRSVVLKLWPAIESLGGLVKIVIAGPPSQSCVSVSLMMKLLLVVLLVQVPHFEYWRRKWDYQWISFLHCAFLCSVFLLFFKFTFISTFHSYFSHVHHSKMFYVYLLFKCVLAKYILFYVCISPRIFIFQFFKIQNSWKNSTMKEHLPLTFCQIWSTLYVYVYISFFWWTNVKFQTV